jgi:septal ring factor EnvC (AmiA/AmiB activator)
MATSLAAPCAAQEAPGAADSEVKRLAEQVTEIAGKQMGLLDRLELTRRRVRLAERVLAKVNRDQAATKKALAEAAAKGEALAAQQRQIEKYLRLRMRQQYALGVLQEYRVFFAVSSVQDLRAAGFYIQALAEKDAESLHQLAALRAEQEATRSELDLLGRKLDQQGREALEERQNLLSEQGRLSVLLARLSQERQAAQQALDELLQAGRKVDRYVADLSEKPMPETNATAKNMATVRGQLSLPCRGFVVKGFGDAVHPRFHTRVPHPGLDIEAPLGTPVSAVYPGKVEFADWLSGYGYTVILSHPGGYFTVYGHLDQVQARKGETVKQSQLIGTVGENAFAASTALYFELRQGSKAVDPGPWLKGAGR